MLVDAATEKNHAAVGSSYCIRQIGDLCDAEVGNARTPIQVVTFFEDKLAPLLPAKNPALAECLVEQLLLEKVMDNPQPKGHIGAGAYRQPGIGLARGRGQARVDHDHARAVLDAPVVEHAEIHRSGFCLIIADINIGLGAADVVFGVGIRHHPGALGQAQCDTLAEVAVGFGGSDVGSAPEPGEQRYCADDIEYTSARAGLNRQCFATVLIAHLAQLLCNLLECLLPANPLEVVAAALADAFQWVEQALRVVVHL